MQAHVSLETAATIGPSPRQAAPWWRFGMVWLVLSGPAVVVVAGFATMAIAFSHADTVLHEAPLVAAPQAVGTDAATVRLRAAALAAAPALQARNHAATPPH